MRIRDVVPQDAEKLVAFRRKLFAETDFLLYGPGEYSATVEEVALYERLGFKFEGLRRRAYIVNGVAVDDHLMGYVFEG